MLELLNQLQPQLPTGEGQGAATGVEGLKTLEGQKKALEFQSLLGQAKGKQGSEEALLNTLAQSPKATKELMSAISKNPVKNSMENLMSQAEVSPEEKIASLTEQLQSEGTQRKSFFPKSKVKVLDKGAEAPTLKELRQNLIQKGGLNISKAPVVQEAKVSKQPENLLLGGFDRSLETKPQVQSQTVNMHFSEDFVSSKKNSLNGGKPEVKTNSKVLNIFEKEQNTLNNGILNKKKLSNVFKNELNTNNTIKEKANVLTENTETMVQSEENLADKLLGLNNTKGNTNSFSRMTSSVEGKAIDLSNVSNPDQLLKEISNYIETSKIQNGKELEVIVNHKDLGQFKVNAQKGSGNTVEIQIVAASKEGHQFFNQQEVNLLKNLSTQGVNVSDFKLSMGETSSNAFSKGQGNDSSGQNFSGNEQGFGRQFNGGNNSHDQGRQKRQELWDQYRERIGA